MLLRTFQFGCKWFFAVNVSVWPAKCFTARTAYSLLIPLERTAAE